MIVQTLAILLVAAWLATLSPHTGWAAPAAVIAAALAGTTVPDLDLALHLGHRSGLTHSVLPVTALVAGRRWWPLAAGLALGLAVHLTADLFPVAMRGYATIKLPGLRSIGAVWSYVWLAANAALAFGFGAWLAMRAVPSHLVAAVLAGVAIAALSYLLRVDGGWWALLLLAVPVWLVLRPFGRAAA